MTHAAKDAQAGELKNVTQKTLTLAEALYRLYDANCR